jgi:hypothetical protein
MVTEVTYIRANACDRVVQSSKTNYLESFTSQNDTSNICNTQIEVVCSQMVSMPLGLKQTFVIIVF